jgi:hypothetical protein
VRARCCGRAAVCRVCGSLVGKKNTMDLIKLFICQHWLTRRTNLFLQLRVRGQQLLAMGVPAGASTKFVCTANA